MATGDIKWKRPKQVELQHKELLSEIGQKLERLRKRKGLSAVGLANELGISRNAYSAMEQGEIYFSLNNFLKILDFHSIDMHLFISVKVDDL